MNISTPNLSIAWYRQFWPWFLILLPGSVVIACLITIGIAIQQPKDTLETGFKKLGLTIQTEDQPSQAKQE